jgi:hypothetical protein
MTSLKVYLNKKMKQKKKFINSIGGEESLDVCGVAVQTIYKHLTKTELNNKKRSNKTLEK